MIRQILFLLCMAAWVIAGTGCAAAPKKTFTDKLSEARESLASASIRTRGLGDEGKLKEAFGQMLTACQATLAGFESQGRGWGWTKVGIVTVGTIAGAVVVPALTAAAATANAVWIAAFGGVSGAANAAQQSLSQVGFAPASVLENRQKILNEWKAATTEYFNPDSDYDARILAIQKGLVACTLYAVTVPGQELGNAPGK